MMNLPFYFAKRYLFSKKSVNAINIISGISVLGVLVSAAALVIVLSFYNGMERVILSQYSIFSPELRIEPAKGKVFNPKDDKFASIRSTGLVKSYSEVLEDKVLIEYNHQQFVGRIKGVEPASLEQHAPKELMLQGTYKVQDAGVDYAILGAQVQANLMVSFRDATPSLTLFIPKKGINPQASTLNPMEEINTRSITPQGTLRFQQGYDDLVLTSLSFAKDLLGEKEQVSAIEINLRDSLQTASFQQKIEAELGPDYVVKNRQQQNPTLYKTICSEKWIVFFIITIIGIIAIFNIIGSLTMLVIDKKKDINVLQSLGADAHLIRSIFFTEGMLISLLGSLIGITLGIAFCHLQQEFGFIRTEGQSLFDAYPVDIRYMDFVLIFFTIMLVSMIVSYISSRLSTKALVKLTGKEEN